MKKRELRELVRELSATGGGASFTPGQGAQYATPKAFLKKGKENRATKYLEKTGYKNVKK